MIYYVLALVASFHGEIKYKVTLTESAQTCEAAKSVVLAAALKDGPEAISVTCTPITLSKVA